MDAKRHARSYRKGCSRHGYVAVTSAPPRPSRTRHATTFHEILTIFAISRRKYRFRQRDSEGRSCSAYCTETPLKPTYVQALLEHNAKVYLAARSKDKAEAAIRDLQQSTGKEAIFLHLDLGNLASVRASAAEFLEYVYPSYIEFTTLIVK